MKPTKKLDPTKGYPQSSIIYKINEIIEEVDKAITETGKEIARLGEELKTKNLPEGGLQHKGLFSFLCKRRS